MISIHAPVKGATSKHSARLFRAKISIHAPVKGATSEYEPQEVKTEFQSTLP